MKTATTSTAVFFLLLGISGCDSNEKATYGSQTGLPSNCRAYVQFAIDSYRSKQYTADETFAGLERNCGQQGHLWSK